MKINMRFFFLVVITLIPRLISAQCVVSDFEINHQLSPLACPLQVLEFDNNAQNATRFEWDFCPGDLTTVPVGSVAATLSTIQAYDGIKIVKASKTQFFGFVVKQASGGLFRLDFGADLHAVPTVEPLGTLGLGGAADIEFIEDNGTWYALVASGSNLIRLKFSDGLDGVPASIISTNLGSFSGALNGMRAVALVKDAANFYALATSSTLNTLTIIQFAGSMEGLTNASSVAVPGSAQLLAVNVFKTCDTWYGVFTSVGNGRLIKARFGTDLTNTPGFEFASQAGLNIQSYGMDLLVNEGSYYVLLATIGNPSTLYELNFGNSIWNNEPVVVNRGPLSGLSSVIAIDFIQEDSEVLGFLGNRSNYELHRIVYPNECDASIPSSLLAEPTDVFFNSIGDFRVELKAFDADNNFVSSIKTLQVATAPEVDFSSDKNCLQATTLFYDETNAPMAEIISWNWDIGGLAFSTLQNPQFEFPDDDEYPIKLEVEDSRGCVRSIEKNIRIYSDDDIHADFSYPDLFCSNSLVQFQDLSSFSQDEIVGWNWSFNDGSGQSDDQNPSWVFANHGANQITLSVTGTSGCTYAVSKQVDAIEGPEVSFSLDTNYCEDEIVFYEAFSDTPVNSFEWDFGDGDIQSGRTANHAYGIPGVYLVTLSAQSPNGCNGVKMKQISIRQNPKPDFSILSPPLSCTDKPTPFSDLTIEDDGSIIQWIWEFDGTTDTSQNPKHTFSDAGDHLVSLTVTNEFGCWGKEEKNVTIAAAPRVQILHDPACNDVPVTFAAEATGVAASHYWEIGTSYYEQASPTHTFRSAGDYPLYLVVTAANGCVATLNKTIHVPARLNPDFSVSKNCVNQAAILTDITTGEDRVVSSEWTVNGNEIFTGSQLIYTFPQEGSQNVRLEVTTEAGCTYAVARQVPVYLPPVASFSPGKLSGAYPLEVEFTNTSTGATQFHWEFLDGSGATSTATSPNYTFQREGAFDVVLTALNDQECEDTFSTVVTAMAPLPNAEVELITLAENPDGSTKLIVTIHNKGNTILQDVPLDVNFSGNLTLRQMLEVPILPGARHNIVLNAGILSLESLHYLCVDLNVDNDLSPAGNKMCRKFGDQILMFPSYPNPTSSTLNLEWISALATTISFTLTDAVGRTILQHRPLASIGFNHLTMDLGSLQSGLYYLLIQEGDKTTRQRIVVSR